MVRNMLETGTPFDYKDFERLFKQDKNLVDENKPIPQLGEQDIPDRDVRFIDKDEPSFEDED